MEVIPDIGLSGIKSTSTPLQSNIKMNNVAYNDHAGKVINDSILEDVHAYQNLVRKLIYLTITWYMLLYSCLVNS